MAVVDRTGAILTRSKYFNDSIGDHSIDLAILSATLSLGQVQYSLFFNRFHSDLHTSLIVYAPLYKIRSWDLPPELDVKTFGPGLAIIVGFAQPARRQTLRDACLAYGLSEIQTNIVVTLLETSNLRHAAEVAGLSYADTRECHRSVLRKLGTDSTPALVTQLLAPSFGPLPNSDHGSQLLETALGLTTRQASLATSIADGNSRSDSARSLGISIAVAKKELDLVFLALGVSSATQLARIVSDARALALLASPNNEADNGSQSLAEPIGFLTHPSGRRIAYSDYGPANAKPVLVLHSSMTNRPIFSALVDALQRWGFRPISMDRPGFGLSDPVPGAKPGQHDPFATAADDAIWFCETMGFRQIDLVARGAAQVVHAIEKRKPELMNGVILVNPDPDSKRSGKVKGPFERMKLLFRKQPSFISLYAHVYARLITPARGRFVMQRSIKGCAPDEAVMENKRNLAEYVHAEQMFLAGKIEGFVNEQTAMATGQLPTSIQGTTRWTILVGEQDFIHDPLCALEYWKLVLPDAKALIVPNAGRFLAISHADYIGRLLHNQVSS